MGSSAAANARTGARTGPRATPGTKRRTASAGAKGKDHRKAPVERLLPDSIKEKLRRSLDRFVRQGLASQGPLRVPGTPWNWRHSPQHDARLLDGLAREGKLHGHARQRKVLRTVLGDLEVGAPGPSGRLGNDHLSNTIFRT